MSPKNPVEIPPRKAEDIEQVQQAGMNLGNKEIVDEVLAVLPPDTFEDAGNLSEFLHTLDEEAKDHIYQQKSRAEVVEALVESVRKRRIQEFADSSRNVKTGREAAPDPEEEAKVWKQYHREQKEARQVDKEAEAFDTHQSFEKEEIFTQTADAIGDVVDEQAREIDVVDEQAREITDYEQKRAQDYRSEIASDEDLRQYRSVAPVDTPEGRVAQVQERKRKDEQDLARRNKEIKQARKEQSKLAQEVNQMEHGDNDEWSKHRLDLEQELSEKSKKRQAAHTIGYTRKEHEKFGFEKPEDYAQRVKNERGRDSYAQFGKDSRFSDPVDILSSAPEESTYRQRLQKQENIQNASPNQIYERNDRVRGEHILSEQEYQKRLTDNPAWSDIQTDAPDGSTYKKKLEQVDTFDDVRSGRATIDTLNENIQGKGVLTQDEYVDRLTNAPAVDILTQAPDNSAYKTILQQGEALKEFNTSKLEGWKKKLDKWKEGKDGLTIEDIRNEFPTEALEAYDEIGYKNMPPEMRNVWSQVGAAWDNHERRLGLRDGDSEAYNDGVGAREFVTADSKERMNHIRENKVYHAETIRAYKDIQARMEKIKGSDDPKLLFEYHKLARYKRELDKQDEYTLDSVHSMEGYKHHSDKMLEMNRAFVAGNLSVGEYLASPLVSGYRGFNMARHSYGIWERNALLENQQKYAGTDKWGPRLARWSKDKMIKTPRALAYTGLGVPVAIVAATGALLWGAWKMGKLAWWISKEAPKEGEKVNNMMDNLTGEKIVRDAMKNLK